MKQNTLISFDWNDIYKNSKYDCKTALRLVKYFAGITTRMSTKDLPILSKLKKKNFSSWLRDPIGFFNSKSSDSEKCIYLMIASTRNKTEYSTLEDSRVPFYMIEDIFDIKSLYGNNLIEIDLINQELILKY